MNYYRPFKDLRVESLNSSGRTFELISARTTSNNSSSWFDYPESFVNFIFCNACIVFDRIITDFLFLFDRYLIIDFLFHYCLITDSLFNYYLIIDFLFNFI